MATQEFQYIGDILKEWYAPAIVNQVYVKSPVWSQVKKTSKGVAGKRVYIPLRHTLSEAVGGLAANDYTLPSANRSKYTACYVWQKRNYGRVQVDGLAIEASKGKGGWTEAFSLETRAIAEAFAIEIDQQVMGRGTAILGVAIEDISGGEVLGVDDPHGITEATPTYNWFRVGQLLDAFDSAGSAPISGAVDMEIESIDSSTSDLTFVSGTESAAGALSDGDFLVRANSGSFSSGNQIAESISVGSGAIMGIDRIVDDDNIDYPGDLITEFQGIDASAAAQSWWRAQVMRTSDTILTEMKIQEDLDTIEQNTDGDAPNLALTTYALRNKLIEIVKSDRLVSSLKLVGGWEAIKYRGGSVSLPIMVHKFCPTGYWYYLNLKYLKFYTLKKLVWDSSGGGVIKPVTGQDQFEAWFKMYGNLATDKRNAMGKVTNYTTS